VNGSTKKVVALALPQKNYQNQATKLNAVCGGT
jgi:hypothetical protein